MTSRVTLGNAAVTVLALAVAGVLACFGDDSTTGESKPDTAQTQSSKPQTSKPKPKPETIFEQLEAKVDLPDFYPSDAPVYPGAKASMAGWQGGRVSAVFSTQDSTEQVIEVMNKGLVDNGWEDLQEAKMPNGVVLQGFKKKGDRRISVLVADLDKGKSDRITMIAISADPDE